MVICEFFVEILGVVLVISLVAIGLITCERWVLGVADGNRVFLCVVEVTKMSVSETKKSWYAS